jgi:hypothetical protein
LRRVVAAGAIATGIGVVAAHDAEAQRVLLRAITQVAVRDGLVVTPGIPNNANAGTGPTVTLGIADKGINSSKLGDRAVTAAKLNNSAVTSSALADGSVTSNKLADGSVTSSKLADGSIGDRQIVPGGLGRSSLNFSPVTLDRDEIITGRKQLSNSGGLFVAPVDGRMGWLLTPDAQLIGTDGLGNARVDASTSGTPGLGRAFGGVLLLNTFVGNGGVAFGDGSGVGGGDPVVGYVRPDGTYFLGKSTTSTDPISVGSYGAGLVFQGAPNTGFVNYGGGNSDPLWISRFNAGRNFSELRVAIGDDGGGDDALVVGTTTVDSAFDKLAGFTPRVRMQNNGVIVAAGSITQNGSPSDQRLKKDIRPLPGDTLDRVATLRGVTYHWSEAYRDVASFAYTDRRQIGVVAQEVEKEFPELVTTVGSGKGAYKTVAYDKLSAVLLESVKELRDKNAQLEARLERLEAALLRSGK